MKLRMRRPAIVAAATVGVLGLALGGQAAADAFITGSDIKNGSVTGADIKTNSISWADIENGGVRGTEVRNGSLELKDLSDDAREELNAGLEEFAAAVGAAFEEAYEDFQEAKADVAADLAALKAQDTAVDTALETLRTRIKAAEGTIEDLAADVASIQSDLSGLTARVDALEASQLVNSNWGNVLRNVIGSATTQLRNGPFTAPLGTGSLEINVATSADKASFGNEIDFAGDSIDSLGSPSFFVYTTGENNGISTGNLPNIAVEIDPDVNNAQDNPINYTTMVFVPNNGTAASNAWSEIDASEGQWYFTGAAGTATGCSLAAMCTFDNAKAALGNGATVYSVAISKGRDSQFHGAVDALRIGGTTYDFEARGVVEAPVAAAAKK